MKKKKMMVLIACIIIVLCTITVIKINSHEQNKKITQNNDDSSPKIQYNSNNGIIEDKLIDGLSFTEIKCAFDGENSTLTYIITNTTSEIIHLAEFEILIKDQDGNVMTNIVPNYNYDLAPNEQFHTTNTVNINLMDAQTMELNLNYIEEKVTE